MTIAIKLLSFALMLAIDAGIWWVIRVYERRGVVLGFPFHTYRDRSPRWFKYQIVMLKGSLLLCLAFTAVLTVSLFLV